MPMFSIIVAIYRVEEWLDECIGSILSQSFTDFELIAVDDCSPDDSLAILRRHAERDARVRTVSLERNVGAGLARNAGLDRATGEYVWFIDGDDWIEPGSLQAIADRVEATGADLVMFGWERRFPSGRTARGGQQHHLTRAPEIFRLTEFPQLIYMAPFPWNKAVKRDLIEKFQYRFESGQYQDIDFTFFMLSAAQGITALDRICVNYRQRKSAVTRVRGDEHFALFDHWERAFSLIEQHKLSSPVTHAHLFTRMVRHFNHVFHHPSRIPDSSRRRFFATASRFHRRFRPGEVLHPPTLRERLRHIMIAANAYPVVEGWRRSQRFLKRRRDRIIGREVRVRRPHQEFP